MKQKTSDSPIGRRRYRSPNGESRIYRDGYRYKLKQRIVLANGQSITVVGSGKTRSQCEANTKKLVDKQLRENAVATTNIDYVAGYCEHWLDNVKELDGTKKNTVTGYRTALDVRIKPHLSSTELKNLKREDIQRLYSEREKLGDSYYVLKDVRAVLYGALDEAVISGLIQSNPAKGVRLPAKPQKNPQYFKEHEVRLVLLQAQKEPQYLARWLLAFHLGLRQGECLALHWDDLDFTSNPEKLNVRGSLSRVTGKGLVIESPKTKSSYRTIPLTEELAGALRTHKKLQAQAKLLAGPKWRERGLVFCNSEGGPIDPANDRKHWIALLKNAGVTYRKLHSARHTTATLMYGNGVPLLTVSKVLGHSSINTTAEFYAHVDTSSKLEAVKVVSEVMTLTPRVKVFQEST